MKVDEFITLYKLLTEQNYYTLPFCMLSLIGFVLLLSGLFSKSNIQITRTNTIVFTLLWSLSLVILIQKRNYDEDVRKDALRIKQYFKLYGSEYETILVNTIKNNVDHLSEARIDEIVKLFPNDFTYSQNSESSAKLLAINDTTIVNPIRRKLETLTYMKIRGEYKVNSIFKADSFFKYDARITSALVEKVCADHPDEFTIEHDQNNKSNFMGYFRRIK
ncbi:MAG: hypothetical protein JST78_09405 [Bacteroidetes bacterium]|nr:hypothetical protein [Bacteroidota bacterium]